MADPAALADQIRATAGGWEPGCEEDARELIRALSLLTETCGDYFGSMSDALGELAGINPAYPEMTSEAAGGLHGIADHLLEALSAGPVPDWVQQAAHITWDDPPDDPDDPPARVREPRRPPEGGPGSSLAKEVTLEITDWLETLLTGGKK